MKYWFDKEIVDSGAVIIKRNAGKDLFLTSLVEHYAQKETTYLLSGKKRNRIQV